MSKIQQNQKNTALSILFQKDGFSFCCFRNGDLFHSEFIKTDDKSDLVQLASRNLHLNQTYDQVVAILLGDKFNLIPNEFAQDKDWEKWLGFNAELFENEQIEAKEITNLDATLVYAFPYEIKEFLNAKFANYSLFHSAEIFLNAIGGEEKTDQIFVNVHLNSMEIAAFKNEKFIFYNQFEQNTKEDLVYYILQVLNQLEMDTKCVKLFYFGKLEDQKLKMLLNFVRHVMPGNSDINILENFTFYQALT